MQIDELKDRIHSLTSALANASGYAEELLAQQLRELNREVDRKMQTCNERDFNALFQLREQTSWQVRTNGDPEWQAEQRLEAMMLGEWDYDTQTPNW
jgi:hypothetical protein